jgi:hypothetical protein
MTENAQNIVVPTRLRRLPFLGSFCFPESCHKASSRRGGEKRIAGGRDCDLADEPRLWPMARLSRRGGWQARTSSDRHCVCRGRERSVGLDDLHIGRHQHRPLKGEAEIAHFQTLPA